MLTPSLVALGYEDFGEIFVAGRAYLRKRDAVPGFNLAITEVGGAFWNASVAVRDYLLAHSSEVDAYAQQKRDAVARGATLFSSYSRDKEPFVRALRDRAMAWAASQPARIRPLTDEDAEALRALRLRAVRQEPDPFASAYEDERRRTIDDTAAFLRSLRGGDGEMLGLFVGTELLGMVGLRRLEGRRVRHRVTLFSMYVAPEARRRGHARALLGAAIANARMRGGVEQLELTVAATSEAARELYLRAGFTVTGRLANALKDDYRHLDEELLMLLLGDGR